MEDEDVIIKPSVKENGDHKHVLLEDGCEVVEEEIMKLYEEVYRVFMTEKLRAGLQTNAPRSIALIC